MKLLFCEIFSKVQIAKIGSFMFEKIIGGWFCTIFVWNLVLLTTKRNSSNFYNTEVSVKIWILNSWKISLWKTSIFCGRIQCWLQFYKIQRNPGKSKIWSRQKLYYLNFTIWVSKVLYRFDIYKRPFINDITPEVERGVQKRKFWAILKA